MDDSLFIGIVCGVLAWVAYFGTLGAYVSIQKGRGPVEGPTLGIVAGPLGLILAALLPSVTAGCRPAAVIAPSPAATARSSR